MTLKTTEKGQALIVIALAAIVLFAFASFAIDGSMAFSDKRHAQNAADTSALAAALARTRAQDWESTARARATSNGYTNNGTTQNVEVYLCNDPNATCTALPTGADPTQYIQVKITSQVSTYFARVIGRNEVTNRVEAVARAVPGYRSSLFSGQSIVALSTNACKAFEYGGSGTTTITGSGIFINSKCSGGAPYYATNQALNSSANGVLLKVPCYNVVGGVTIDKPETLQTGGCTNIENNSSLFIPNPTATFPAPDITCDPTKPGTVSSSGSTTTIGPGYYGSSIGNTFPPNSWQSDVVMQPGVYCIDLGTTTSFSMQGGQILNGNNVLIYMKTGSIKWTSGEMHLSATADPNSPYKGLLIAMAPTNCAAVGIAGNNNSSFTGTILTPCSAVSISGSSGTTTSLKNQIIADTISLGGGGILNINYEASEQWQPPMPPAIEMTQ